ncbi:hypothetical protein SSP24_27040 [Streptomyces spinoverrucosus]|uniref:Uncharacterized protein n=1 Tax=Streptomyces spinoverrucosus TaxID=284043 RepID=A0A4Y3VH99_9ACTN|nr:hypothetical protein [Streptomyces spinoverrucosus]GEC05049.1 hypothetical protein SSP24_27040 [Streptomyces spinoverrucosus]GHB71569.1 hypothetical protein GCM10010397_47200 [Streptomyces spinoverrucosus]
MTHTPDAPGDRSFVVIGETNLALRVYASLRNGAHTARHLTGPGDEKLRATMTPPPEAVAVLLHDDVAARRGRSGHPRAAGRAAPPRAARAAVYLAA